MGKGENEDVNFWIKIFNNAAGRIAGGLISSKIPGTTGLVLGSLTSPLVTDTLQNLCKDFKNRQLSNREQKRVGSTIVHFIEKFNENVESGKEIRNDNFFDPLLGDFSTDKEVLEGVLQLAQRSYEEKKVPHLSYFFANIIFDNRYDGYHANRFLKMAEGMSYRQFCLIAIYFHAEEFGLNDRYGHAERVLGYDLVAELLSLKDQVILGLTLPLQSGDGKAFHFPPTNAFLTTYGEAFYNLFDLSKIPLDEILKTANRFIDKKLIEEIRKKGSLN